MEIRHENKDSIESKAHLKRIFVCFSKIKFTLGKILQACFRLTSTLLLLQSIDSSGINSVHCL